jgi:hypothetical protein
MMAELATIVARLCGEVTSAGVDRAGLGRRHQVDETGADRENSCRRAVGG